MTWLPKPPVGHVEEDLPADLAEVDGPWWHVQQRQGRAGSSGTPAALAKSLAVPRGISTRLASVLAWPWLTITVLR